MSVPVRRPLPPNADLDQQKKLAKELLAAFTAGDADAVTRIRARLPDKPRVVLADAQFVLAREYGLADWVALTSTIKAQRADNPSPEQRMMEAVHKRDTATMRSLFASYAELRARINDPVHSFDSPAVVAFANDLPILEVLLEFGADPNRRSEWWAGGFHALYSARGAAAERLLAAGAIPDACAAAHLDMVDLLANMIREDPARVHERGGDGQTPLHFAVSRRIVDLLLEAGADIDAVDVDHRSTPAHWMLDRRRGAGRYDLAKYLVERGASVDIFLAAALGLTDRAVAMIAADPSLLGLRTGQGEYAEKPPSSYHISFWTIGDSLSPLDVAAQFDQRDTHTALLDVASPVQRFLSACRRGDAQAARAMVREDPGMVASLKPSDHRAITDATWNRNAAAVSLMLDLGFDPRTPGQDRGTALHCAAWGGSVECVTLLLRHPAGRALVAVRDETHDGTPLDWCCHGSLFGNPAHDHAGVARLLLDAGATVKPNPIRAHGSPSVAKVLSAHRKT